MIDISHALSVEGFMEIEEMEYLAKTAAKSKTIVEIGSWKGRSACAMAANTSAPIFCVDTWSGKLENGITEEVESGFLKAFLENTRRYSNVMPICMSSVRAADCMYKMGMRFDMIFIDATHTFESCCSDILAWRPLLTPGGILCGHDLGHKDWQGVEQAVDSLIEEYSVVPETSIWTTEAL